MCIRQPFNRAARWACALYLFSAAGNAVEYDRNRDDALLACDAIYNSGRIDESEIFYFRARGIRPSTARKLISFGFTREVIDRIGDEPLIEMVVSRLEAKFNRVA